MTNMVPTMVNQFWSLASLLGAPGIATRSKVLGARTLLGAPGPTTRSKKLLGAKGIATSNPCPVALLLVTFYEATMQHMPALAVLPEICRRATQRWTQHFLPLAAAGFNASHNDTSCSRPASSIIVSCVVVSCKFSNTLHDLCKGNTMDALQNG